MDIGEYKIKLQGIANIPKPLRNGFTYDMELKEVEVRKIERIPTDDGKEDEIASLRISELSEVILKSGEKQMKAKVKGSQSKLQRYYIEEIGRKLGLDPEKYYQERMSKNIENLKFELDN